MFLYRSEVRARRAIHFYDFDGAKQDIGVAPRRTNRTIVKRIAAAITFSESYEP
jgi:hypothetical protein